MSLGFGSLAELPLSSLPEAAASGAYTITANAGSYAYTGVAATITRTRVLSADAGSYPYTGQDATIARSKLVTADAGSYPYTGIDATITYTPAGAYTVTAEAGNYPYTGQAATIDYTPAVSPATQFYSGGYVDLPTGRRRTKRERDELREELGILPKKVAAIIKKEAKKQAPRLDDADDAKTDKLIAELERIGQQYKAMYADLLREQIRQEMRGEEEAEFLLLM